MCRTGWRPNVLLLKRSRLFGVSSQRHLMCPLSLLSLLLAEKVAAWPVMMQFNAIVLIELRPHRPMVHQQLDIEE
jgi:hypothetical protein